MRSEGRAETTAPATGRPVAASPTKPVTAALYLFAPLLVSAALSGLVTALVALAVSWRVLAEGGWGAVVSLLVPLVIAVGFSWWGGRVGSRKRAKKAA